MTSRGITIRRATTEDAQAIWPIFQETVAEGTAFLSLPETTWEEFLDLWFGPSVATIVATIDNQVVGSYILKSNHHGRGSHVANGSYMVASCFRGRGIGEMMGRHSLAAARAMGFRAMQFNMVVSTNEHAIRLWQKIGFEIVGTLPKVFAHPSLGLVDAYVMYRFL